MCSITCQRTLILYTGGTIGMVQHDKGLVSASGFEQKIRGFLQENLVLRSNQWQFKEITPLIDSANMTQTHWQQLASQICQAAKTYDSVLVLQGTDTLAYTAASLSFQLLGLTIPVLLTGAMYPVGVPDSDAEDNIQGALLALTTGQVNGVQVYFQGNLLSGTRCYKWRSNDKQAFISLPAVNAKPLCQSIAHELQFEYIGSLPSLIVLPIFPGLSAYQLRGLMGLFLHGIVLECYGSGTAPCEDKAFIDCLEKLIIQGVVVVAISQCPEGNVDFSCYEASSALKEIGVVSGGNLSREAAVAKLSRLLGLGLTHDEVVYWFSENLCGEYGVV